MEKFLNVDRVAFSLFGYDIYWYGLIICFAIVMAVVVATLYCKIKKYDTEMPINIALVILPTGILGARLFSVLFDAKDITQFFNFRDGGMSIIGAVIGGGLALLIFCLIKNKQQTLLYFDVLAVVLIFAQAIGRWGNYFNGEVYGEIVSPDSALAFFPFAVLIDGVYYQALFFYEFLLNMIAFGVLSLVFLKGKSHGYTTALYLTFYGVIRTVLEPLRQDQYILKLSSGLAISRICSIAMIAIGVVMLVLLLIKDKNLKGVKNGQKTKNR